jgi:hypothetical protein
MGEMSTAFYKNIRQWVIFVHLHKTSAFDLCSICAIVVLLSFYYLFAGWNRDII